MSIRIPIRYQHAVCSILASGFLLLWIVIPLKSARADEIRLITGITVHGKIVHEDEKHVVLEGSKGERFSLPRERIESIEQSALNIPFNIPLPDGILDSLPWERLSGRLSGIRDRLREAYAQVDSFVRSRAKSPAVPLENLDDKGVLADKEASDSAKTAEQLPITIVRLLVAACLFLYGYVSFCLARLAKHLRISHEWTAWVPVLQPILWLRIGGRSILWLLVPVGLSFVGSQAAQLGWLILGLVSMLSVVYQCQRSAWLALLLCVPGINLIVLGYLAFSQKR